MPGTCILDVSRFLRGHERSLSLRFLFLFKLCLFFFLIQLNIIFTRELFDVDQEITKVELELRQILVEGEESLYKLLYLDTEISIFDGASYVCRCGKAVCSKLTT